MRISAATLNELVEVLRDSCANSVSHLIALERVSISDCSLTRTVHHHAVHLALLLGLDEVSDRARIDTDIAQHGYLLIGEELWKALTLPLELRW